MKLTQVDKEYIDRIFKPKFRKVERLLNVTNKQIDKIIIKSKKSSKSNSSYNTILHSYDWFLFWKNLYELDLMDQLNTKTSQHKKVKHEIIVDLTVTNIKEWEKKTYFLGGG